MPDNETSAPTRPTLTQRRAGGASPIPRINSSDNQKEVQEPVAETAPIARPIERGNLERPMINRGAMGNNPRPAMSMGMGSRPVGLDRNSQPPIMNRANPSADGEKSSPIKVVIWIIIAIALAVASYFAIRNAFQPATDNTGIVPTILEPTVEPTPAIVGDEVMLDIDATNRQAIAAFNLNNQSVGKASEATFSINTVTGTRYETFTRFSFGVSRLTGPETAQTPLVTARYDATEKTITLNFAQTTTATADDLLMENEQISVNTPAINLLVRKAATEVADDVYTLVLKAEAKYVLQIITPGDSPQIVLDVMEPATPVVTTPVVTGSLPSGTPKVTSKVTATPVPTSAGGDILENIYSQGAQELRNGLASNTADMVCTEKCFSWIDTSSGFTYDKPVSLGEDSKYPNVSAKLEDTTLTITITNLISKNQTSNVTFTGSRLVNDLKATRTGNTLVYVYSLKAAKDYRILFTESNLIPGSPKVLRVQIKP